MLHQFYPDYEADSAYGIDYRTLYERGYRGIIFDIDNTLGTPRGTGDTAGNRIFRQTAGAGISDASIIEQQGTPREKLCGRSRWLLIFIRQANPEETAICGHGADAYYEGYYTFVGDQLFTDVGEPKMWHRDLSDAHPSIRRKRSRSY